MRSIRDVEVRHRKVLLREDYNVPMDAKGNITSDARIIASLPTIKYLMEQEAKIIIISHMGRPKGREEQYSLHRVADRLALLTEAKVMMAEQTTGEEVEALANSLQPGEILMLENVRFEPGETCNDALFSKALASLGEIYVNDAFSASHRKHASVSGIADLLPAYAGFAMEKELIELNQLLDKPRHPFILLQGGAKVSNKIGVIKRLLEKLDVICIGGGMAFTFLKAEGFSIGRSYYEKENIEVAEEIISKAAQLNKKLVFPVDFMVTDSIENPTKREIVACDRIPENMIGVDIGPSSIELFKKSIVYGKTILTNGPMGIFEREGFGTGTMDLFRFLGDFRDSHIVAAGGDTSAAIEKFGLSSRFNYISLGGGATLEYLEGKELPGVKPLL
jgi:phosphoglycerate kinase